MTAQRLILIAFGVVCLAALIWFGGELLGPPWDGTGLRAGLIAGVVAAAGGAAGARQLIRRRRARAVEAALAAAPA